MKRQRHSEEQIIAVLKEAQAGGKVEEVCRRHGISQPTYYKWKQRFGGLEVSDAKRLRHLEDENRKLKKLVADQALDVMVLKEIISKKY
jgi:putative transposase